MSDVYEGRNAEILRATIDGSPYDREPESVIEYLLLELKKVIEEGGGGGGTTNYNALSNKPQINDVELSGNKSLDDLGIQSELTFDSTPTENSTNPVTSGGVYNALSGAGLEVDDALSSTSENPVQNKVIYTALEGKQDELTFDNTPTENSNNPVKSGGVYLALAGKQDELTFDSAPTASSDNPVTSGGVYTALSGKEDSLTFDSAPTASSTNPVTSGGVYTALAGKQDTLTIDSALSDTSENPVQNKVIYSQIYEQLYTTLADLPNNAKGSMELYSKNLNNITTSGFYNAMTCTNAPFDYMTLIVTGYYLSGYCTQIACDVTTGNYMFRTQTGGTWGAWTDNVFGTFNTKQDKTLTTPVVVEGTSQTTVEAALGAINTSADKRLISTDTMPTASADLIGKQRLYVGTTTATYTKGTIYECQLVPESDPAEYEWIKISSAEVPIATTSTAGTVKPDGISIDVENDGTISANTNVFNGTLDEWDALTPAEQSEYSHIATPDNDLTKEWHFGSGVDINNYTSSSPFTAPNDGVVHLRGGNTGYIVRVNIDGLQVCNPSGTDIYSGEAFYPIKKGQTVYRVSYLPTAANQSATYYPYN